MDWLRALMRFTGCRIHVGWRSEDRWGFIIRCKGCGEQRQAYQRGGDPTVSWWETTASGDGSCGVKRELPTRY